MTEAASKIPTDRLWKPRRLTRAGTALAALAALTGCNVVPRTADNPGVPRPARAAESADSPRDAKACGRYAIKKYGIDPNKLQKTGGGGQLVTVVANDASDRYGKFTAWNKDDDGCWSPAGLGSRLEQPFRSETGVKGFTPLAKRVPGSGKTPTGLFPFGDKIYGLEKQNPNQKYPYHRLKCGDWWDELKGSPTYDTYQKVGCGDTPDFAASAEKLWQYTESYKHFIHIDVPNPPDKAAGIFLHHRSSSVSTIGCVALPADELVPVLKWLDPEKDPHILIKVA
ncbi:MAG TPA: hypothetical protein VF572_02355 [Candidatus Saccharimonadales bacterium]|jgi:L,D-peptidoglycan transpeptidase YkuD (ErfK/YbiS/YcfS/YnhG family)